MNKQDLVRSVAEKAAITQKDAEKAINAVVLSIKTALGKGEKVSLVGFGTFEVRTRAARSGRNPQNGLTVKIPAVKVPAWRPGQDIKEGVANAPVGG